MKSSDTSSNDSRLIRSSEAYKYAADVLSGKIVACKRVQQACQRFMDELKKSKNKTYPWRFDIEKAYRPIDFIEKFLKPTKGEYTKMELMPWQHFVQANLYGWVSKKTGYRRFREGIIIVGSGNGKSTLVVGNALCDRRTESEAQRSVLPTSRPGKDCF